MWLNLLHCNEIFSLLLKIPIFDCHNLWIFWEKFFFFFFVILVCTICKIEVRSKNSLMLRRCRTNCQKLIHASFNCNRAYKIWQEPKVEKKYAICVQVHLRFDGWVHYKLIVWETLVYMLLAHTAGYKKKFFY